MNAKELLEEHLDRIGWTLRLGSCEHYLIYDHLDVLTNYVFFDSSVTNKNNNTVSEFHVEIGTIKMQHDDMVQIGTNNSFVLFMNHDKK